MTTARDIGRLISGAEPRMALEFRAFVARLRRRTSLLELAELAENGRLYDALEDLLGGGLSQIATPFTTTFQTAGAFAAVRINQAIGEELFAFDPTTDRAVGALRQHRLRLIRGFSEQQRAATERAIATAIRDGLNPRDAARAFRGSIGLTPRQTAAVGNFRRMLHERDPAVLTRKLRDRRFDSTVRAAIAGRRPLSRQQIDQMVTRYEERYLKYRSEVIARTESLRAVHTSTDTAFGQAIDEGALAKEQITREWNTAKDERVRTSHAAMHGQTRGEDEAFTSGAGNSILYPGDPNAPPEETIQCRCAIGRQIVATAEFLGAEVIAEAA